MNKNVTDSRRTPIDHTYPSCDRTCANLLIYPAMLSQEEITKVLHMEPTESQNKGEQVTNSSGRTRIAKSTYWEISSEPFVTSMDLRAHLDWLLDQIGAPEGNLPALQENHDVKMCVNCIWWSRAGHGGPTLWPEQMSRLANLNLECTFDVQFYTDDPDDGPSTF